MGYNNGPKIVTDSLGLYIDAGNVKSYPGTGTAWNDITNNGLNFSGNASYITPLSGASAGATWSTGSISLLDTDNHSIFFRIRFNSTVTYPSGTTGGWEKIFGYPAGGSDRSPGIWRWPSNRWIHWRYDPGNSGTDFGVASTSLDTGNEFPLNTWYMVGVTKSGGSTVIYVNGKRIGTGAVSSPKTAGSSSVYIFEYYTNPLCNVDNLFIYNKVLTDSEVLQNYNALKGRLGLP